MKHIRLHTDLLLYHVQYSFSDNKNVSLSQISLLSCYFLLLKIISKTIDTQPKSNLTRFYVSRLQDYYRDDQTPRLFMQLAGLCNHSLKI
jgi:hypothetical protein